MRRTSSIQLVVLALTLVTAACGGGGPTAPSSSTNFQGVWQGTWLKASCSGTNCEAVPPSGALRLTLAQSATEVQGTVELVQFIIPASGAVNANGALSLSGQAVSSIIYEGRLERATVTLSNWSTTRSGTSMSGNFRLTIVPDNSALGSQIVELALQNVTRSS